MDNTFGVRFQFDCVGSRQCAGCLSEVWEFRGLDLPRQWRAC